MIAILCISCKWLELRVSRNPVSSFWSQMWLSLLLYKWPPLISAVCTSMLCGGMSLVVNRSLGCAVRVPLTLFSAVMIYDSLLCWSITGSLVSHTGLVTCQSWLWFATKNAAFGCVCIFSQPVYKCVLSDLIRSVTSWMISLLWGVWWLVCVFTAVCGSLQPVYISGLLCWLVIGLDNKHLEIK